MLRCNIETTLQFPYSTSVLLDELKHDNKVLSDQWNTMLAAIAPVPTYGFLLSLDDAKARIAAAKTAAQASEPQLGDLADQLYSDNFLDLNHRANGPISKNPGEVVALIKTMKELDGLGYEVDWRKSSRMFLGNDNNTIKSSRFRTLMTTNLGNEGRIHERSHSEIANG
jgi:hypothetical protein